MKLKVKVALLGLGAALLNFPFNLGNFGSEACARMWGDFLGDALILSVVD